jgi:Uncharacterised nucleotidyltransferase
MISGRGAQGAERDIGDALARADAPRHIIAVLKLLQFGTPSTENLCRLDEGEWQKLLCWCDARQLTMLLPYVGGRSLPPHIAENIFDKTNRYAIRFERLKASLFEIADAFQAANLEFVLLKGISHAPDMTPDALLRAQGDIDLWLRGSSVYEAAAVLRGLGYSSISHSRSRHLGPMTRPNSWRWQGDLFDPDMPISVELHYELWSAKAEYIEVPQLDLFWARRTVRDFAGHNIAVLCQEDLLGFAALHLLLHLVHGDLPLQRAWEIAHFLETHADDDRFWKSWSTMHHSQLRQIEAAIYYLVCQWFGCRLSHSVSTEIFTLGDKLKAWLFNRSLAPLVSQWRPNKCEIWLHLTLVKTRKDQIKILLRRLFPLSLPSAPQRIVSPTILIQRIRFLCSRFLRHLFTLAPTLLDGLRLALLGRL